MSTNPWRMNRRAKGPGIGTSRTFIHKVIHATVMKKAVRTKTPLRNTVEQRKSHDAPGATPPCGNTF